MKKSWKIYLIIFIILVVVIFLLWFFLRDSRKVTYQTETVKRGDVRQTVQAGGDIIAMNLVDVGAQASGQIKKMYVQLGEKVAKGQLIATIDATSQINEINTNRSKLSSLNAQLKSKEIALQIAEKNYKREKDLWAKDATSRKELESAEDTLFSTRASILEIKASIKQVQIALSNARANLGYTRIESPLNGTVVSAPVREGQTINSVQSSPMVAQIADLSKMIVRMQIPEGDVTKIKKGMTVEFTTLADPNTIYTGVLQAVDPGFTTVTRGSYSEKTDTSTSAIYYFARAVVDNKEGMLHIGMTTENTIIIKEAKDVLYVPTSVIRHNNKKYYVEVFNDKQEIVWQRVQIGIADNMNTQIIAGLKEGQEVISDTTITQEENTEDDDSFGRRPPPRF